MWLTPLILLLIAHALVTVIFDVHLIYLRVVSLLIPLPFSFILMLRNRPFVPWVVAAFVMAGLAVLGMSYTTHLVDEVSVLPETGRDWREFAEYAASIGFSYITGMILGDMRYRRNRLVMNNQLLRVVTILSSGVESVEKIRQRVEKVQKFGGFITAASTTAASIYNGLKNIQH